MIATDSILVRHVSDVVRRSNRGPSESRPSPGVDRLVVELPPHLAAVIERESLRTGRSSEGLLAEAIARYLATLPPVLLD